MPVVQCEYALCYDNDNQRHICLRDATSFNFTGVCEYIQHCDDYTCDACERFIVCTKEKKNDFLREQSQRGGPTGGPP